MGWLFSQLRYINLSTLIVRILILKRLMNMKLLLLPLSILLTVSVFGQSAEYKEMLNQYYDGFPTITIEDAVKNIGKKETIFLDIREKEEFNVSHIQGATRMRPDGSTISTLKNVRKDQLIIVYCSVGARSQTFGEMLQKDGFTNVVNMYGGLFYWANMHYPMVDIKENKTERIHGYNKDWGKWVKENVVY